MLHVSTIGFLLGLDVLLELVILTDLAVGAMLLDVLTHEGNLSGHFVCVLEIAWVSTSEKLNLPGLLRILLILLIKQLHVFLLDFVEVLLLPLHFFLCL